MEATSSCPEASGLQDPDKYPIVDTYFEGLKTRRCISPLNAVGKKNIAITGFGTIDGQGDAWRWIKRSKLTEGQWNALLKQGGVTGVAQGSEVWAPTQSILDELRRCDMNVPTWCQTDEDWQTARDFLRPALLDFAQCENVWLQGVCFQNSPAWNLHPFMCQNVIIDPGTARTATDWTSKPARTASSSTTSLTWATMPSASSRARTRTDVT